MEQLRGTHGCHPATPGRVTPRPHQHPPQSAGKLCLETSGGRANCRGGGGTVFWSSFVLLRWPFAQVSALFSRVLRRNLLHRAIFL